MDGRGDIGERMARESLVEWMECEGRGDIWEEMEDHDIMSLKVPTEMKIDQKFTQRRPMGGNYKKFKRRSMVYDCLFCHG
jgi:hypothetical protein